MKPIVIGIMPQERIRERVLLIAGSIAALAAATGRKPSNLSRTLKTMSNYGIVELRREQNQVRPVAKSTEFRILAQ